MNRDWLTLAFGIGLVTLVVGLSVRQNVQWSADAAPAGDERQWHLRCRIRPCRQHETSDPLVAKLTRCTNRRLVQSPRPWRATVASIGGVCVSWSA